MRVAQRGSTAGRAERRIRHVGRASRGESGMRATNPCTPRIGVRAGSLAVRWNIGAAGSMAGPADGRVPHAGGCERWRKRNARNNPMHPENWDAGQMVRRRDEMSARGGSMAGPADGTVPHAGAGERWGKWNGCNEPMHPESGGFAGRGGGWRLGALDPRALKGPPGCGDGPTHGRRWAVVAALRWTAGAAAAVLLAECAQQPHAPRERRGCQAGVGGGGSGRSIAGPGRSSTRLRRWSDPRATPVGGGWCRALFGWPGAVSSVARGMRATIPCNPRAAGLTGRVAWPRRRRVHCHPPVMARPGGRP